MAGRMIHARVLRAFLMGGTFVGALGVSPGPADVWAQDWSVDGGDSRQKEILARYKEMLESNPSEGMAFQRVLEYVGRGKGLDGLIKEYEGKVKARPGQANLRLVLGHFLRTRGDNDAALAEYSKAVELAPKMPLAWLSRGKVLMLMGKRVDATADFERALELEKNRENQQELLRQLADLSFAQRDFERAEKYFDRLVALEPRNEYLRMEYAQALVQYKRFDKAILQYEAVLKLAGGNQSMRATTLRDMADVYAEMGRADRALETYNQALKLVRSDSWLAREVQGLIVNLYRREDRLHEYVDTVAGRWSKGSFDEQMLLGDMYQEVGRLDDALSTYAKAAAKNSRSVDPRIKTIRILERRGDDKAIVSAYEGLIRIAPTRYQYQFDLARHLFRMGDRARGVKTLDEIGRRFSREGHVQVQLADQYTRYDMNDKAQAIYEKLVRQEPKNEAYILSLGEFYFQAGEREKAISTWKKLIDSDLGKAQGNARLGEVLVDRGMVDQGIGYFAKAVELAPNDVRLHRGLAQAYERARRWDSAVETWMSILERATQPAAAGEARARVIDIYARQNLLRAKMREFAADFAEASSSDASKRATGVRSGYFLAESHMKLQEISEAEVVFARILELERAGGRPANEALLALEKIYTQRGEFAAAIGVLEQLVEALPQLSSDFYHRMADLSLRLSDDQKAVQFASRALEANPDDAMAHARLGEVYQNMHDLEEAAKHYRTAIELDSRAFNLYVELAEILIKLGDSREAERLYRMVIRQSPDDGLVVITARKVMAMSAVRGRLDELETELHPLLFRSPPRPVFRNLLIEVYGRMAVPLIERSRYGQGAGRASAVNELDEIAGRAQPVLLDALQDRDVSQRVTALTMLGDMKSVGAAATIGRMVEDPNEALRVPAAIAAANIGDSRASEGLLRAANDAEPQIREISIWALGFTGGKSAAQGLERFLKNGQTQNQRILAAISLGRIGSADAAGVLSKALAEGERGGFADPVLPAVVWALGQSDNSSGGGAKAVALLGAVARSDKASSQLVEAAVASLAKIALKNTNRAAIEALLDIYWSENTERRAYAGQALSKVAAGNNIAEAATLKSLPVQDVRYIDMRVGNVRAGKIVDELMQAQRSIVRGEPAEFLMTNREVISQVAFKKLKAGGAVAKMVVQDLYDSTTHGAGLGIVTSVQPKDSESAALRAAALGEIVGSMGNALRAYAVTGAGGGAKVEPAMLGLLGVLGTNADYDLVVKYIGDESPEVRAAAVGALAGVAGGSMEASVFEKLIEALQDPHYSVRAAAIASFGRVLDSRRIDEGKKTLTSEQQVSTIAEKLVKHINDSFFSVQLATIVALGQMNAGNSVETLVSKLVDDNRQIRLAVLEALRQINTDEARAAVRTYEREASEVSKHVKKP